MDAQRTHKGYVIGEAKCTLHAYPQRAAVNSIEVLWSVVKEKKKKKCSKGERK